MPPELELPGEAHIAKPCPICSRGPTRIDCPTSAYTFYGLLIHCQETHPEEDPDDLWGKAPTSTPIL